jgi:hypothetical protein
VAAGTDAREARAGSLARGHFRPVHSGACGEREMVCAALYSSDGSSPKATKALSASLRQRRPNSITQSSGSIWTLLPSARSIESRPPIGARQELLSVLGCWQFCSLSALAREMSECPRHALYVNPDLAIVTVAADRGDECPRCSWLGLSRAGTPCEVRRLSSAADPPHYGDPGTSSRKTAAGSR